MTTGLSWGRGEVGRARHHRPTGLALLVILLASLGAAALAPGARAGAAWKVVHYRGYRLSVPAAWPVFDLARSPGTCVRFDRHAVYVGTPGTDQVCPAHAAGHTEAILVEPLPAARAAAAADAADAAALPSGSSTRLVNGRHRVVVLATWSHQPQLLRRALGVRVLPPPPRAVPARVAGLRQARYAARARTASAPGAPFTGLGFDACSTPSQAQMNAWASSPYSGIAVYIGGANMACLQSNLTAGWVSTEAAAGWHIAPIYVGLQAPANSCGCAAIQSGQAISEGTAAASDAISEAQALGLGPGNPVYYDMEAYPTGGTNTQLVMNFLAAWTSKLHAAGYVSGIYSSSDSGITDLANRWGTSFTEPDDIWIANWNGVRDTSDPNVPSADWANHQRLHQYSGSHDERYGGVTINIDGDYFDGATAAAGGTVAAAPDPSLRLAPASDGSLVLRPSWKPGPAVSSWQVLGGSTPLTLAPVAAPFSSATASIVVHSAYPYFAVSAIGPSGQSLGSSQPIATPPHLSLAGSHAFASSGAVGSIPVGCFNPSPCHVTTRLISGRRTIASTGSEGVPPGGGSVFFSLPLAARQALARAHGRLPITVSVRDVSGMTVSRPMTLTSFTTAGRRSRSVSQSPSIQVASLTSLVSHGWVGGILARCHADSPCTVTATLSVGRTVIASPNPEFLGANELGYLVFPLTARGHALLRSAKGNQLAVTLKLVNGSDQAVARIVLAAF